jgi:hypothetical protein
MNTANIEGRNDGPQMAFSRQVVASVASSFLVVGERPKQRVYHEKQSGQRKPARAKDGIAAQGRFDLFATLSAMSAICAELSVTRSFQISSVDVADGGIPIVRHSRIAC